MTRILGIMASQISGHLSNFESIATAAVSTNSTTISFTSIPSTYSHLQIRWIARTNRASSQTDSMRWTFNSDAGANYARHGLYANGSASAAFTTASQNYIETLGDSTATTATTGIFGTGVMDILDYTSTTKNKTIKYISGAMGVTATINLITLGSGLWFATPAAITSITIVSGTASSFIPYTQVALYGVK